VTQAPDPVELTEAALKAHAAGDLAEAARLYDQILRVEPRNWLALTNRATLWLQTGRLEEGVEGLRASLALSPSQPTALNNLGNALRMLGRPDEAIAAYREAIVLVPAFADAWDSLALTLHEAGRLAEAAEAYGGGADAAPELQRPRHAQGLLLHELGRNAEALAALEKAAALPPAAPELFNDLGLLRHDNGQAAEAVQAFSQALALRPGYADALSNQARALHHLDCLDAALEGLDRALAVAPDHLGAWLHRGDALSAQGRFQEALASYDRVLQLDPGHVAAWVRHGDVLGFLRRIEDAMASYNQALTLDPGNATVPFNLAAAMLREGAYADGWRLYEHRWRDKSEALPVLPGRLWLGEETVEGKTVLLHSEQGQGDTLMMLRYAPLLARRGARVLLSVQGPLERLAASLDGVDAVIPQGRPLPPFDRHTPMMSLPLAFATEYDTVPGEPYLKAPAEDAARWAERLGPRRRPRIGLCWTGNPSHNEDRWRSVPLDALRPLAGLDADLYAVQIDIRDRDRAAFDAMGVIPLGPELTDYASTAGLIEALDLIITVDTSVAHLTGALGRRGYLLLAACPDYRWGWDDDTTPWYPSLNLFRQERIGDWSGVVEAARGAAQAQFA
jgi:tetratricopeptide (TPR) repeat protein